jgi:hypothetical protein
VLLLLALLLELLLLALLLAPLLPMAIGFKAISPRRSNRRLQIVIVAANGQTTRPTEELWPVGRQTPSLNLFFVRKRKREVGQMGKQIAEGIFHFVGGRAMRAPAPQIGHLFITWELRLGVAMGRVVSFCAKAVIYIGEVVTWGLVLGRAANGQ